MRRVLFVAGAAAVAAGVTAWIWRRAVQAPAGGPGTLPGESSINSWLNGPLYTSMASALDLRAEDDLLDVACGEGAFLVDHASHVHHVAGIDLAPVKVELAQKRLADRIAEGTAEIVMGDAAALPWPTGTFNVVTCMDALTLMPDPERVLAEMRRVLRPGGRLVLQMGWRVPDDTPTHRVLGTSWVWSEPEARRMTEAAGFGDVTMSYVRLGGTNRLGNFLIRRVLGTDEARIVMAVKPGQVLAAHPEAGEAVAVG